MTHLVWLDLEMSGLDVSANKIIEIAVVVTDKDLNLLATGPDLVIYQTQEHMATMDAWCTEHHKLSGLTEAVLTSNLTEVDAENAVIEFIKDWVKPGVSPMCGNSIGTDRAFIERYMPKLASWFHYRNFDVSSFKLANNYWSESEFAKTNTNQHRAQADILESIKEAKYYKDKFFSNE